MKINSVLPAIIVGAVGLISAALSATIAILTIRRSNRQDFESRSQQLAITLLPRRLDALERIWREVFEIEKTGIVPSGRLDELISAALWVSEDLREILLSVLLNDRLDLPALRRLRTQLLEESAVTQIDTALRRLAVTEGGSKK